MASTTLVDEDSIYASLEYCSVACNNSPGCLSWSYPITEERESSGEASIFYGACNAIVEYDFEVRCSYKLPMVQTSSRNMVLDYCNWIYLSFNSQQYVIRV